MTTDAVYRTPEGRFAGLPGYDFEPHYLEQDEGLRMHYVDEGSGDPILMLHGEPTWSYLYRKMIPPLARSHRAIAPDLFGFGRSDKPTDRAFYTYERHVASIVRLVDDLDLSNATVVVQDWGGPIGLRVAAVERPDRFARLVILNTGLFRPGPDWPTPGFQIWRDFAERTGLELPVGLVMEGSCEGIATETVAAYEAPFPEPAAKTGAAMFPLLVPMGEHDPGVAEMLATREAVHAWEKPALVMFSDGDPIFPARAGERLAERIAGPSEFQLIEGARHFLQEDRGEDLAERIEAWLST
ncbi:MAG: haloalkane dehalogenase [Actinomycetota bacterium]